MSYIRFVELCTLGLFLGMLLFLEVGRRLGLRRRAPAAEGTAAEGRVVEGAVFGLLGLLVAFTFSGAAARFDTRRQLIVEETNAIGTAYLRLDLLPTAFQKRFQVLYCPLLASHSPGSSPHHYSRQGWVHLQLPLPRGKLPEPWAGTPVGEVSAPQSLPHDPGRDCIVYASVAACFCRPVSRSGPCRERP